jgi:hypothetical protein
MSRPFKFILFTLLTGLTIYYINDGIGNYDMRFYNGKDDGYVLRLQSICVLSCLFYVLMSERKKILNAVIGLASGLAASIIAYLFIIVLIDEPFTGTVFHIFSCILFILLYFAIQRYKSVKNNL